MTSAYLGSLFTTSLVLTPEDFRCLREHLFFFTRSSISRVLRDCGWEVLAIEWIGHTFQLGFLLDRIAMISAPCGRLMKALVHPRWLLDANFYVNPRTKILIWAKPKA